MTSMLIVGMWRHPLPSLAAAAVAAAIFLWPALPLGGLDQWLFVYLGTPYLLVLYPVVAVLSGLYVGLVVYHKKIAPACPVEGARLGAAGSAMGVLFGVCPACIPVVAVFLPLAFKPNRTGSATTMSRPERWQAFTNHRLSPKASTTNRPPFFHCSRD